MLNKNNIPNEAILTFTHINITFEPLPNKYPEEVILLIEDIYATGFSEDRVHQSIKDLNRLIDKYPKIPVLYNFLSVAYEIYENREQSGIVIKKCYDLFPDYIFGVCNYARFLFFENYDPDAIPKTLKNKFNIYDAFPKRKEYHISEVELFYTLQGHYYAAKGNIEMAERLLVFLEKICHKKSTYVSELRAFIKEIKRVAGKNTFHKKIFNKFCNLLGA